MAPAEYAADGAGAGAGAVETAVEAAEVAANDKAHAGMGTVAWPEKDPPWVWR